MQEELSPDAQLDVLETGEMCMVIIYQTNMFLSIMEFLEEKQKSVMILANDRIGKNEACFSF